MSEKPSYEDLEMLVRRQAAAISEQEARFKKIMQTIPLGLIVFNQNHKVELCNSIAQKIFGYEPREFKGKSVDFLFPDLTKIDSSLEASRARAKRVDGEIFPVELYVHEYEDNLMFVHLQDITERVRLEKLRQDLLAMVSHDLRSPLTSIQFVLSVAVEGGYGELTPKALKALVRADSVSERMIGLVNDLLDSETFESGEFDLDVSHTTTKAIVEKAVDNSVGEADKKNITFAIDITNDALQADESKLIRVLSNLIGNAIKFTPNDSAITLSGGMDGTSILFRVSDQGPGVPEQLRTAIFERYRQLESKNKKAGVGLGLYICKAIVEKHGGRIWVENNKAEGATFCVSIPLSPH